ncbi:putative UDP-N-acetylglucosamine 2-epimerase [Candidatus Desulfarcum epimagneticum]|uniref:UDP-N-acetylglucosamine 2-epimerase (non-hydrolyzing) n=1 Tax=uncultured Desulfobacteraceae bacterium TaxID=218296 RepID=A0A484HE67_9BACT|nr:putative UDP-N-acetylglucosamine 2-epimerase [uncultured Desulfobacteraceae bacterium]
MKKIIAIIGTRPEAIKMAPVIFMLKNRKWAKVCVVATAQHREMMDQALSLFGITPDLDLNLMKPHQTLPELTAKLLTELDKVFCAETPDAVLAQGDTTTVMTAAMASFYRHVPFGHVEAGLRTGNLADPFPEEMNRVVVGRLARWHFAPTESARENLLAEGINKKHIHFTGNTVIDALLRVKKEKRVLDMPLAPNKRFILLTVHRRKNFGKPMGKIMRAVLELLEKNKDIQVLYPRHPNTDATKLSCHKALMGHPRFFLSNPLDYMSFIMAMKKSYMILTDSGGVQEEAPFFAKPTLVLRNETERPEGVREGVARLVGAETERIVSQAQKILDDKDEYIKMAKGISPYGDGHAAGRIVEILKRDLAESEDQ